MENLKTIGDAEIFKITKQGTVSKMETVTSGYLHTDFQDGEVTIEIPEGEGEKLIEVFCKKYRRRPPQKKSLPLSSKLLNLIKPLAELITFNDIDNKPNFDIIKEYELVMQKQSKLSHVQRDAVINLFEYYYEEVNG